MALAYYNKMVLKGFGMWIYLLLDIGYKLVLHST